MTTVFAEQPLASPWSDKKLSHVTVRFLVLPGGLFEPGPGTCREYKDGVYANRPRLKAKQNLS